MAEKISLDELYDFNSIALLKEVVALTRLLGKEQEEVKKSVVNTGVAYRKTLISITQEADKLERQLKGTQEATEEGRQEIVKLEQTSKVLAASYKKTNTQLEAVDKTLEELTEEQQKNTKANEAATEQLKKLQQEEKEQAKTLTKLQKLEKESARLKTDTAKQEALLTAEINLQRKALREQAKAIVQPEGEYKKLSRRLVELRTEYKNVATAEGVVSEEAQKLLEEVRKLDAQIKEIDESAGQFQRNVGNYPDAFQDAGKASGVFKKGIDAASASLKALLANPVIAIMAALAAALKLVFDAFKRSTTGAIALEKAQAVLQAGLSLLTNLVDKGAQALQSFFEDPLGALRELGESLKQNLINRFQGALELASVLGQALRQLWERDFDGLRDSVEDAGEALLKIGTGQTVEDFQELGDTLAATVNQITKTTQGFLNLAKAEREVRNENRELSKQLEQLIAQEEELLFIRDDATRGFLERIAAGEQARAAIEEAANKELQIARNTLNLLNQEVKLRKANGEDILDLLDQQAEAFNAVTQAESRLNLARLENEQQIRDIRQAEGERNLDILLDGLANQVDINNRIIGNERTLFEERRRLQDENRKLSEEAFKAQIENIQEFTDQAIDANSLLAESDAITLNERIRALGLSEILEGRLLEVIRDRRTGLLDLAEQEQELVNQEEEQQKRRAANAVRASEEIIAQRKVENETNTKSLSILESIINDEIALEEMKAAKLLENDQLTADERAKIQEDLQKKLENIARDGQQRRIELIDEELQNVLQFVDAGIGLVDAFNQRREAKDEERLKNLESRREKALANENLTAEESIKIEKRFDSQRAAIEREGAQRARRFAIFQKALQIATIVAETAVAVSKTLVQVPIPANVPAAIAVGALGAARAATVAALPIPAFYKGTDNAPGGLSIIDELGPELIVQNGGVYMGKTEGAKLVNLQKGAKVIPADLTQQILTQVAIEAPTREITKLISPRPSKTPQQKKTSQPVQYITAYDGSDIRRSVQRGNTKWNSVRKENRL